MASTGLTFQGDLTSLFKLTDVKSRHVSSQTTEWSSLLTFSLQRLQLRLQERLRWHSSLSLLALPWGAQASAARSWFCAWCLWHCEKADKRIVSVISPMAALFSTASSLKFILSFFFLNDQNTVSHLQLFIPHILPFQACGRKRCKSFTHDGFSMVQCRSCCRAESSYCSRLSRD